MKRYLAAWIGLLAMTALTVGASSLPLGVWSTPIALTIAAVKASIVLVAFMHLLEHPPAVRLVLATTLVFVGLILFFVQLDVLRRSPLARPQDPTFDSRDVAR